MTPRMVSRVLLTGAMSVLALTASTGIAHADSEPFNPSAPGIIDQILTQTPALFVDPSDEGGPSTNWGGVGMYCENMFVKCH